MQKAVTRIVLLAVVVLAFALAMAMFSALAPAGASPSGALPSGSPSATPSGDPSSSPSPTPTPTATPTPPPPLKIVSVVPHRFAKNVAPGSSIHILFAAPLAADTPVPKMTPAIPGKWRIVNATSLVFSPTGHLPIYTTVHLTIPAGATGVHGADGRLLAVKWTAQFSVRGPTSMLRCQQLLAELGYLPLRFRLAARPKSSALAAEPRKSDLVSLSPLSGKFSWRYGHIPSSLSSLWKRGSYTTLIKGVVMAFESDHGLATDGVVGRNVWLALLRNTARHHATTRAYDYVQVYTSLPQALTVWRNGRVVFRAACNTGIASRPTPKGTTPVWARFVTTTMSGTNPDGTHYNDPGVPWVAYFNGGCAIHGFIRPGYGWPQSLGCVELTYANAAVVFRYDPIGTLVTVH